MSGAHRPPPPDWGKDSLTGFFNVALQNSYATYFRKQILVTKLKLIDSTFGDILKN